MHLFLRAVHPATWFKIRFDDGEVCTFRPSAFILVDEDGMPSKDVRPKTNSAEAMRAKANAALAASAEAGLIPGVQSRGVPNVYLLMDLEADLWVGAIVRVIAGKFTGVEGVVLRSGNGWVQIETSMFGEIAKRAHELEVLRAGAPQGLETFGQQHQQHQQQQHAQQQMNAAAMQMKRSRADMESAMFDGMHEDYSSSGMRAPMRMAPPRARPSSPSDDGSMGGAGMHWPQRQAMMPGSVGGMGPAGMGSMPPTSAYAAPMMGSSAPRASPGMMPMHPAQQAQHVPSQQAPLIHPNLKEAQYQYMQKYVKKMKEKFKSRPDMRFWSNVLRSSHLVSGGEPDPYLDAHMAREFNDAVCPSCLCERWPLSKYCWNESCPASPVYWKLTGRPPVPPQFGPAATASIAGAVDQVPDGPIVDIGNYSHLLNARRHQAPPKPNRVVDMYMNQPGIVLPTDAPAGSEQHHRKPEDATAYNPQGVPLGDSARRALYTEALDPPAKFCGDNWSAEAGDSSVSGMTKVEPDNESHGSSDNSSSSLQGASAEAGKGDDTAAALADMKNSIESGGQVLPINESSVAGSAPPSYSQPPQAMHHPMGSGAPAYMDASNPPMPKYAQAPSYPMPNRGPFLYGQGNGGMYPGPMALPGGGANVPSMYGNAGGSHFMNMPSGISHQMGPQMGDFGGLGPGLPSQQGQQGRFPGGASGMMNPSAAMTMNRSSAAMGQHVGGMGGGPMGQLSGNGSSMQSQFYGRGGPQHQQQQPFYGASPSAMMQMHSGGYGPPPGSMPGGNMRLPPHYAQQQQQSQSSMMMMHGMHHGMGMGAPGMAPSQQQQMQQQQMHMHSMQSSQRDASGGSA